MRKIIAIVFFVGICLFLCPHAIGVEYQYAQVTTQKGPLNMRASASTKATKIDEIPNGTIITIVSDDGTWCECLYNSREGFVMTKYLSFMELSQFRALSLNDSGEDILALKERLRELYYFEADAVLDNQYDSVMENAIKACQAAQGMEETGQASPQLQALVYWGPAKNNLPTQAMTVKINCSCSNYNHVGNSWSQYFSINGEKITSGGTRELVLGESITVYSKITENDKSPDVGSVKEAIEITQEYFESGFSITQKVSVRENKGRYSGNKANWTITYTFTPQP